MNSYYTIGLLVFPNTFMTFAWHGQLKFKELNWLENSGLISMVEYFFQVPANRIGFKENGGSFSLVELKVLLEVIAMIIFMVLSVLFFNNETIKMNHIIGYGFLILVVYFIFKK